MVKKYINNKKKAMSLVAVIVALNIVAVATIMALSFAISLKNNDKDSNAENSASQHGMLVVYPGNGKNICQYKENVTNENFESKECSEFTFPNTVKSALVIAINGTNDAKLELKRLKTKREYKLKLNKEILQDISNNCGSLNSSSSVFEDVEGYKEIKFHKISNTESCIIKKIVHIKDEAGNFHALERVTNDAGLTNLSNFYFWNTQAESVDFWDTLTKEIKCENLKECVFYVNKEEDEVKFLPTYAFSQCFTDHIQYTYYNYIHKVTDCTSGLKSSYIQTIKKDDLNMDNYLIEKTNTPSFYTQYISWTVEQGKFNPTKSLISISGERKLPDITFDDVTKDTTVKIDDSVTLKSSQSKNNYTGTIQPEKSECADYCVKQINLPEDVFKTSYPQYIAGLDSVFGVSNEDWEKIFEDLEKKNSVSIKTSAFPVCTSALNTFSLRVKDFSQSVYPDTVYFCNQKNGSCDGCKIKSSYYPELSDSESSVTLDDAYAKGSKGAVIFLW